MNNKEMMRKIVETSNLITLKASASNTPIYMTMSGLSYYAFNRAVKRSKNSHKIRKILNACEIKHQPMDRMYKAHQSYNLAQKDKVYFDIETSSLEF